MINFIWGPGFKRSYKKSILINPALKRKIDEALTLFSLNPSDPILLTHKLSGKLKDYYAFTGYFNTKIIFKYISEQEVLLIDIGSHEVFYQ